MIGVRATAPCRVDLAGGTLDLWPLGVLVDGAVTVNVAVDVMTGCTLQPAQAGWTFAARGEERPFTFARLPARPEREAPPVHALAAVVASHLELPPCRVETWSEASRGSGLGGSSSLLVALLAAAFRATGRAEVDDAEAVALACDLETRVLGLPAGSQDHWAARCGGVNVLEHAPGGTRRRSVVGLPELAEWMVVADTRVQHHSGQNNWTVFRAYLEGAGTTRDALEAVADAARLMRDALLEPAPAGIRLPRVREALRAEWQARRQLSPAVSCPEVEAVVAAAESVGGAAKVCGAGGGGCAACLPGSPDGREALAAAVAATGARILSARPTADGVEVTPLTP